MQNLGIFQRLLIAAVTVGILGTAASAVQINGSTNITVTTATLVSLEVTAPLTEVPVGVSQQVTAIGTYSDGFTADLTNAVVWSSSAPVIASITADGVVTGQTPAGSPVQIIATKGAVAGAVNVRVNTATLLSIEVTRLLTEVPVGISQQFTAIGTYSDGFTADLTNAVLWASSAPVIASVTADGVVTGFTPSGTPVQIIATKGSVSGSANVKVNAAVLLSLELTAPLPEMPVGVSQRITAVGTYTNGFIADVTHLVLWSSSAPTVATVTADGLVTGQSPSASPVDIVASKGSVTSAIQVTINSATLVSLELTAPFSEIPAGVSQQVTAIGTYSDGFTADLTNAVVWTSSAPVIASVTANGIVTGHTPAASPVQIVASTVDNSAPVPITVIADPQTAVYGSGDPELTYQYTGTLAPGDSFSGSLSRAPGSSVGSYEITQGSLTLSGNYVVTFTSAVLTITPALLTVTADDKTITEGDAIPPLSASYSGFVAGETLATSGVTGAPALSTTATAGSPPGAYPISIADGTLSGSNYSFVLVPGTLTVIAGSSEPDGRMFGSGFVTDGARHQHFVFRVQQKHQHDSGRFEYWVRTSVRGRDDDDDDDHSGDDDHGYGRGRRAVMNRFEATSIALVTFNHDSAVDSVLFRGTGKWNGRTGYIFEVTAVDRGEPGRHRDTFSLVIRSSTGVVASVNGALGGGNIQSMRLRQ